MEPKSIKAWAIVDKYGDIVAVRGNIASDVQNPLGIFTVPKFNLKVLEDHKCKVFEVKITPITKKKK